MKKLNIILILVIFFGFQEAFSQTKLDEKIEQLEQIQARRDSNSIKQNNRIEMNRLNKMSVNRSNFDFSKEEDLEKINMLLQAQKDKNGFKAGAIVMTVVGASFTAIGTYATYVNANGGQIVVGIVPLVVGLSSIGASIPLHLSAKKKKKEFLDLKYSFNNPKHF